MKSLQFPLVSVVTVVYNAKDALSETLANVSKQGYANKEVIVIDGGSTDGTIKVIEENAPIITNSVSERDYGIYDAMNKGILRANGKWLIFMNAGDVFYSSDTLSNIFEKNSFDGFDVIYGKHVTNYGDYSYVNGQLAPLDSIWKKMPFSHQAVFCKTEWLKKRGFDTTYKVVADHDMMYEYYRGGAKFHFIDEVIAIASLGGVSDTHRIKSYRERLVFIRKYPSSTIKVLYFRCVLIKEYIFSFVKHILGQNVVARIVKVRNAVFREIED
ncbi:MAG: glycosyltransferase family 2 protein [Imperialibacter sp.]|uniref:glycosyltransferase family 2 protein n=1 Tax=Imperialibacter sp. TaxID=2038411 RepID=UPI0032EE5836